MQRMISVLFVAVIALTQLSAVPAGAADLSVSTLDDAGPGSLRQALANAAASGAGSHTIDVQVAGTITLTTGALTYAGSGSLNIDGNGIDIDANGSDRGFTLSSSGGPLDATLEELTVFGGAPGAQGGAIRFTGDDLTLDEVTIRDNSAAGSGEGGGVYFDGGDLTITDSTFLQNDAAWNGGAVWFNGGEVSFTDTTVQSNIAQRNGGGVFADGDEVSVDRSSFLLNSAEHDGGAIHAAAVDIDNSTFVSNEAGAGNADGWGGAIRLLLPSSPDPVVPTFIRRSTFDRNKTPPWANATRGVGASIYGGGARAANTFEGNVFSDPIGSPHCAGVSTFSGNAVDPVLTRNNYSWQDGPFTDLGAGRDGHDFCGFVHSTDTMSQSAGDDPDLGAVADNGGPTLTALPGIGSPLIDRISGGASICGGTDQRGSARPDGTSPKCDIGSVEGFGFTEPPSTTTGSTTTTAPTPTTKQPPPPREDTSKFVPLPPKRVFDTRAGGPSGKLSAGETIGVTMRGVAGIPDSTDVTAVVLNVTATESTKEGFVTVYPSGGNRPLASNLNLIRADQTAPNLVTVPLGVGGRVNFYSQNGTHLLADVAGYFTTAGSSRDGRFVALTPKRLFDTRTTAAPTGFVASGAAITVDVDGRAGLPSSGVSAVALNLTADAGAMEGYVTAYPSNVARPVASTLNLDGPGHTVANMAIVPVSPSGEITFYSHAGAHLLADVFGYFTDDSASPSSAGLFRPLDPHRAFDTRIAPSPTGPLPAKGSVTVDHTGVAGVPETGVAAVIINLTAAEAASPGFVTVSPSGTARPLSSNLNLTKFGEVRPNAALVRVGSAGRLDFFSQSGAHLLTDVAGYFTA